MPSGRGEPCCFNTQYKNFDRPPSPVVTSLSEAIKVGSKINMPFITCVMTHTFYSPQKHAKHAIFLFI